jgi:hypothetical protein
MKSPGSIIEQRRLPKPAGKQKRRGNPRRPEISSRKR